MTQFNDSVVKAALRYASDEGLSTTSNNFNDLVWLSLYNYLTGTVGLVLSPTVSLNELITLTAANYLSVPWGQMDQLVFDALGVYLQGKVDPIPGSLNGRIIEASEFFSNRPVGPPPVNTVAPAITGAPNVGNVLTVSNGTWDNTPTGYTYTWQISIDGLTAWSDIPGETTNTYTIGAEMESYYIRAIVTASNDFGNASAPSNVVGPVVLVTNAQYIGGTNLFTSTTFNIPIPAGSQAGDLMIVGSAYSGASGITVPAGWTKDVWAIYTASQTYTVAWKVLTTAEITAGTVGAFNGSTGSTVAVVYRGATTIARMDYKSNATSNGALIGNQFSTTSAFKGIVSFFSDRDVSDTNWSTSSGVFTPWNKRQRGNTGSYSSFCNDCFTPGTGIVIWGTSSGVGSLGEGMAVYELR